MIDVVVSSQEPIIGFHFDIALAGRASAVPSADISIVPTGAASSHGFELSTFPKERFLICV